MIDGSEKRICRAASDYCRAHGNQKDVTKTGNGEWGMGNGEWEIENGKWEIENGKLIFFVSLFHYLKLYLLLPGWSVRLVKNCDRGLENVASAASGSIFQA